jgi:S1-C subfamily serine protease
VSHPLSFIPAVPIPARMLDNETPASHDASEEPIEPAAAQALAASEPLDAYSAAVVGALEQVGPAVVSVYVGGALEAERARGGAGSGVVVTPDGYLLTNEHVVQRVNEARVTFVDGRSAPAVVAGRDPANSSSQSAIPSASNPRSRRES